MGPRSTKIQLSILFVPVLIGVWFSLILPRYGSLGFVVISTSIIGLILLISAKISEKKRTGKTIRWGFQEMILKEKISYIAGYVFIGISLFEAIKGSIRH